jgi:membrane associated rhomboid family serine protease
MRLALLIPRVSLHRPGGDPLTLLCLSLVVVQVLLSLQGGFPAAMWIYETFGLTRAGVLSGRVWQVGTHPFLHAGWIHLLLNWLVVFLAGGRVFHILGGRGFTGVFAGGVLGGSALHLLFHPATPLGIAGEVSNAPLVGASGGAMALLVAVTTLSPDSRMWPLAVSGKNLARGILLATFVLFLITPGLDVPALGAVGRFLVASGLGSLFEVGHIYHFGGGLAGWLYVKRLLRRPVTLDELRRQRAKREGRLKHG